MTLPQVLNFEGIAPLSEWGSYASRCYYERLGYRPPLKGEWYVSGAIPFAYRAPNDISTPYHVVRPTFHALSVSGTRPGPAVK